MDEATTLLLKKLVNSYIFNPQDKISACLFVQGFLQFSGIFLAVNDDLTKVEVEWRI
jgi:prophage maintenance system killer protein